MNPKVLGGCADHESADRGGFGPFGSTVRGWAGWASRGQRFAWSRGDGGHGEEAGLDVPETFADEHLRGPDNFADRHLRGTLRGLKPFDQGYAAITPDATGFLVDRGVAFVGVDYLSVAPFDDAASTHHILLQAGVCVVEGIRLQHVDPGDYEMIALPLQIAGADAAPTRVLLRAAAAPEKD